MPEPVSYQVAEKSSKDWKLAISQAAVMNLDWTVAYGLSLSKSPDVFGAALFWAHKNKKHVERFSEFWAWAMKNPTLGIEDYLRCFLEQGFEYPEKLHPYWCPAFCIDVLSLFIYLYPNEVCKRFQPA